MRLSEDRFYERFPCILITGKGFPDMATRAMVHALHNELQLPVYGLCDCNPFGIAILQTYQRGSAKRGIDGGDRYTVPIQWAGLRPSQLSMYTDDLPNEVYQSLTDLDRKKIEKLCEETSPFINVPNGNKRLDELYDMAQLGYKVELEALHWLGMDKMCEWLEGLLRDDSEVDSSDDQQIII